MSTECSPRFGLLNIMPSPAYLKTEHQWRDVLSDYVDIVPVRFDDDPRDKFSRVDLDNLTLPISDVASSLDGFIVTGANLELCEDGGGLPYNKISYFEQLREIIEWTSSTNGLSVFSCLASHIALKVLVDIDREIKPQKTFGVFDHEYAASSWITSGLMSEALKSPHSRWGDIDICHLAANDIEVVAASDEVGWLIAESNFGKGKTVFLQGHPEYQRDDLYNEYRRDRLTGSVLPRNYFIGDDPSLLPDYSWADNTQTIFSNLVRYAMNSLT